MRRSTTTTWSATSSSSVTASARSPGPAAAGGATTATVARADRRTDTNRLTSTSAPGDPAGGPFSATYQYDVRGNMTRMPSLPGRVGRHRAAAPRGPRRGWDGDGTSTPRAAASACARSSTAPVTCGWSSFPGRVRLFAAGAGRPARSSSSAKPMHCSVMSLYLVRLRIAKFLPLQPDVSSQPQKQRPRITSVACSRRPRSPRRLPAGTAATGPRLL